MNRIVLGFLSASIFLGVGLGAAVPGEKTAQFSLGVSALVLSETYSNGSKGIYGPGLRIDLNLGRSLIIAPEISGGVGGWSAGGTVNFRSGKFFAGAGYLAASLGGNWEDWGVNSLLKVQVGAKGPHWLVAASYVTNRWLKGFGLTAGYVF